jgi:hypothetical protein
MAEDANIEKLARNLSQKTKCPECGARSPQYQWNFVEREHGILVVTLGLECKKCAHLWEQTMRMRPSSEGGSVP